MYVATNWDTSDLLLILQSSCNIYSDLNLTAPSDAMYVCMFIIQLHTYSIA